MPKLTEGINVALDERTLILDIHSPEARKRDPILFRRLNTLYRVTTREKGRCAARCPDGGSWECTLPPGHPLPHVGHNYYFEDVQPGTNGGGVGKVWPWNPCREQEEA